MRDILYDGHPKLEKGAIMGRYSESLIRFGTFDYLASQKNKKLIKILSDYVIERNFPDININ